MSACCALQAFGPASPYELVHIELVGRVEESTARLDVFVSAEFCRVWLHANACGYSVSGPAGRIFAIVSVACDDYVRGYATSLSVTSDCVILYRYRGARRSARRPNY